MNRKIWYGFLRWGVRLFFLASASLLTLHGPLPEWLAQKVPALAPHLPPALPAAWARVLPGASPLTWLASSIADRRLLAGFFLAAVALAVLLLTVWRGRLFCRWVCPAGTLYTLGGKVSLKKRFFPWRISGVLFWAILAASLCGVTVGLSLEPLSSFSRLLLPAYPEMMSAAAWIPGLIIPLFLVLGCIQPLLWCGQFCPLGYAFDLAHGATRRGQRSTPPVNRVRRDLLAGVVVGLPLALLWRRFGLGGAGRTAGANPPVVPPGAGSPERFARLCTRCYACVQTCPTKVIRVGMPKSLDFESALMPELDAEKGFCTQYCNRCTQVCPAGAIRPLSEAEKQQQQIGIAVVYKEKCLAWTDGEHCMVCQEMCPYGAISIDTSPAGIPRPVVHSAQCRGCGFCQNQCPATRAGKAILVHGVPRQTRITG